MEVSREIRNGIRETTQKGVSVIITETCGCSFSRRQTGNAIECSRFSSIWDFLGDTDLFCHVLNIAKEKS
jgi:coenzyme F420-0:L-glutamate ligase/coenzyme F420-1:gamma-L-glutamate ligase